MYCTRQLEFFFFFSFSYMVDYGRYLVIFWFISQWA